MNRASPRGITLTICQGGRCILARNMDSLCWVDRVLHGCVERSVACVSRRVAGDCAVPDKASQNFRLRKNG